MSAPLLEVGEVWKRYGGRAALAGVSLQVGEGEALGIVGPNGSGKSTLLDVVSRLVEPDAGRVRLAGEDLLARPASKLATHGVARVFQSPRLSAHLTAFENVALGLYRGTTLRQRLLSPATGGVPRREGERVLHWLRAVGLAECARAYPRALTHFQARCAELARALVAQPRLLLLDEPTAGFSREERAAFARLLGSVRAPATAVVLIEHDFELIVETCDRVLVLDAGRPVASGPPAAVRMDPAVLDVYFGGGDAGGL
ncbi:MAG TPA: ATP-binding cassette domain-containing protein [Longimicrobium sp.]|nr:ATP-binding cassette domain-containing protein [Longimicrobium sp.]